jgi:hypothetical protein
MRNDNGPSSGILRTLWRVTLEPVYNRLIKRYFDATIGRLTTLIGDIARISARLDELDAHIHALLEAGWEEKALARRMAMLEDRLGVDGQPSTVESLEVGAPEHR